MDKKENQNDLNNVDNVEIEPLSDEDLESVAGGLTGTCPSNSCSTSGCSNGQPQPAQPIAE